MYIVVAFDFFVERFFEMHFASASQLNFRVSSFEGLLRWSFTLKFSPLCFWVEVEDISGK